MKILALTALLFAVAAASPALADPCKAIPDHGPLPDFLRGHASFHGPVSYVGDGDSLCVAVGSGPENWVEVRLEDFYAPELHSPEGPGAKAALERVTRGRELQCRTGHQSYDRVVAICTIAGVSVGSLMRKAGIAEGGNAFKPAR
jgi:micrococcal nuclease